MPSVVIVGAQWGDEGKGKVVDSYGDWADIVARFNGGANAGHTIVVDGKKFVTHVIPSGVAHKGKICLLGGNMMVAPWTFRQELADLADLGLDVDYGRIKMCGGIGLVMRTTQLLDAARENAQSGTGGVIGTTQRGMGPGYADMAYRTGLRAGLMLNPERFGKAATQLMNEHRVILNRIYGVPLNDGQIKEWAEEMEALAYYCQPYLIDGLRLIKQAEENGKNILVEGAQAIGLDNRHGTYPFVTSSSCTPGGAIEALGLDPKLIQRVIGVMKGPYCTRVGKGSFPTRMDFVNDNKFRDQGHEYGASTGRARACGWNDLLLLNHGVHLGIREWYLTKMDVTGDTKELPVAVFYKHGKATIDQFPAVWGAEFLDECRPVYLNQPNWQMDKGATKLPPEAMAFIRFIENRTGRPVNNVSTGPEREETVNLKKAA